MDEDLERAPEEDDLTGRGSETAVSRVLWDLTDGGDGPPDQDGDGIAIGASEVLRAMMAQFEQPGAYPALSSFLRFLVERGTLGRAELAGMLPRTGQPTEHLLPADPEGVWPPARPASTPSTPTACTSRTRGCSCSG